MTDTMAMVVTLPGVMVREEVFNVPDMILPNSTINNRPLGFNVSKDKVLTPNQFTIGQNYDKIHSPNVKNKNTQFEGD